MRMKKISIHALLTESDRAFTAGASARRRISIHALLTESDPSWDRSFPD